MGKIGLNHITTDKKYQSGGATSMARRAPKWGKGEETRT